MLRAPRRDVSNEEERRCFFVGAVNRPTEARFPRCDRTFAVRLGVSFVLDVTTSQLVSPALGVWYTMSSPHETPWILRDPACANRAPDAPAVGLRVICLPQAGAGAYAFHGWQKRLPPHVEVCPVEYPGRNSRFREPMAYETLQELACAIVDNIAPLLPKENDTESPPYVVLGWSMGAWLGYEVVCEIQRRRDARAVSSGRIIQMPLCLYAGGARAPSLFGPNNDTDLETPSIAGLPDREFWRAFERRYGANPELQSSALRSVILPTLRKDFGLMETYVASGETFKKDDRLVDTSVMDGLDTNRLFEQSKSPGVARLEIPLLAFGAQGDGRYTPAQISRWTDVVWDQPNHLPAESPYGQPVRTFRERWFRGVNPNTHKPGGDWKKPHRLALDYPDEVLEFLSCEFEGMGYTCC